MGKGAGLNGRPTEDSGRRQVGSAQVKGEAGAMVISAPGMGRINPLVATLRPATAPIHPSPVVSAVGYARAQWQAGVQARSGGARAGATSMAITPEKVRVQREREKAEAVGWPATAHPPRAPGAPAAQRNNRCAPRRVTLPAHLIHVTTCHGAYGTRHCCQQGSLLKVVQKEEEREGQ